MNGEHQTPTPENFNRLDRPEDQPDQFVRFKDEAAKRLEYREAYLAMEKMNPASLAGFPHPDSPVPFDVGATLETLRRINGGLQTVPPADLRT